MSATPPAITVSGSIEPGEIDPMLEAIRSAIVLSQVGVLAEFGETQVVIVPPDETEKSLNAKIALAMSRSKGLCLLLIAGDGKNPDPDAPGPMLNLALEMQLYVSTAIRGKSATAPLSLMVGIAKLLHHGEIGLAGISWYERLKFLGFESMADPEFTAYALNFEREMQL